jgi:hypothetical protein
MYFQVFELLIVLVLVVLTEQELDSAFLRGPWASNQEAMNDISILQGI